MVMVMVTTPQKNDLWRQHHHAVEQGQFKIALGIARREVDRYSQAGDLKHAGVWMRAISNVLHLQGIHTEAAKVCRAAVRLQPDPYERGLSLIQLGQMLTLSGQYKTALDAYRRARTIADQFPDDIYIWTHFFGNRALVYMRTGHIDKAIIEWEGAASLLRQHGHLWRSAIYINNIAFLLLSGCHLREAEQRLIEALELIEEDPHLHTEAVICDSFGCLYTLMGRPIESQRFLKRAIKIFERLPDENQLVSSLIHLSELYETLHHYDDARDEAVKALDLAAGLGREALVAEAREQLKRVTLTQIRSDAMDLAASSTTRPSSKVIHLEDYRAV